MYNSHQESRTNKAALNSSESAANFTGEQEVLPITKKITELSKEEVLANRRKTNLDDFSLYEEILKEISGEDIINSLPLSTQDSEEENKTGISPHQELNTNEKDKIITELKNFQTDFYDIDILIDYSNKYYYVSIKVEDDTYITKRLSNFVIYPLYSILDENGKRSDIVKILNNKESKIVTLDAETKSVNRQFKILVLENGKFNWIGSQKHLDQLVQLLTCYNTNDISEISYIGWHEDEKAWFFPTHAYVDGEVYYPDENGIFKTHRKNYILKKNSAFNVIVPHISERPTKEDIIDTLSSFKTLYGASGWLGIGFAISSMQVKDFSRITQQHPFLYAHGMRNYGKTEFLKNIFHFSGMNYQLPPPPRLDGIRKRISWFSHLPIGYDEAEEKSSKVNDFFVKNREHLNTIFNRSPLEIGTNDPNKLIFYPVRGTLVFGGEIATSDSAITTRSVFIDALKINQNEEAFHKLDEHLYDKVWLGQFMIRTSEKWKQLLFNNYKVVSNHFRSLGMVSSRVRKNFAMLAAGAVTFTQWIDKEFGTAFYSEVFLSDLLSALEYEMVEGQKEAETNHHAITYLKDLAYLAHRYKLYKTEFTVEGNLLYVAPDASWRVYEEWKKDRHYQSSRKVANDLRAYDFFLGTKSKRIQGRLFKCWVIDMSLFPEDGLQGFMVEDRN